MMPTPFDACCRSFWTWGLSVLSVWCGSGLAAGPAIAAPEIDPDRILVLVPVSAEMLDLPEGWERSLAEGLPAPGPEAIAQTPEESTDEPLPESEDGWVVELQPTILLPLDLSGDVTLDGAISLDGIDGDNFQLNPGEQLDLSGRVVSTTTNFDLDLGNILDFDSLLRLSGRVQARKDDLILIFDGQFTRIATEETATVGPVSVLDRNDRLQQRDSVELDVDTAFEFRQGIFDLAASYRVFDRSLSRSRTYPVLFVEPIAGVRIGTLDFDVELNPGPDIGGGATYAELLTGARLGLQISEKITLGVRGDVSGLGVGNTSKVTWNFITGLDWQATDNFALRAAYRIYEINIDGDLDTSDDLLDDTTYDLSLQEQGLWLGFTFFIR